MPGEARQPPFSRDWPRAPAVPVTFAISIGILIDRQTKLSFPVWLTVASLLLGGFLVTISRERRAGNDRAFGLTTLILACCVCIGGLRHHSFWSLRGPDNISTCLSSERSPVRLVGRLASPLVIDETDHSTATAPWKRVDRTVCRLACAVVGPSDHEISASGLIRVEVTGHLLGPQIGDRLELYGILRKPSGPRNPGGFDYADWLRRQGLDAVLYVEHPDHVLRLPSNATARERLARRRNDLRKSAEALFVQLLPADQVPLAKSLILGDRSGLPRDVANSFAESGTMHLLAISGLHVGILAGLVHLVCRLLRTGPRTTTVALLVIVLGYALVTDQRPPVLRAALLATVVLSAWRLRRDAGGYQSLAVCAIAILLYRPADLFDPGAQLSFVAVLAILWSGRRLQGRELEILIARERFAGEGRRPPVVAPLAEFLRQGYVLTASIWVFTLPLTAWHFHLCSPIGLIVNVLLIPVTALMLAAGYLMLLVGLAFPLLAAIPAALFSGMLSILTGTAFVGAETSLGHRFVPAPPLWWIAFFYLILSLAIGLVRSQSLTRPAWKVIAIWTIVGLALPFLPQRSGKLRVTFLSVGHGCAVLIETPSGRTLLYDAGSYADGTRAARIIESTLWEAGRASIDAVIVSHADVDHFNALPELMGRVPIGALFLSPTCLDFEQERVADLCESATRHGVRIKLIQKFDRIIVDSEVDGEVLHPSGTFHSEADNANSVVLSLTHRDRSFLFTGDIEGAGLQELLRTPPRRSDVLMAPHHGSRSSQPESLLAWANPQCAIASTADDDAAERLLTSFGPGVTVLSTANSGAVSISIDHTGRLEVTPFVAAQ